MKHLIIIVLVALLLASAPAALAAQTTSLTEIDAKIKKLEEDQASLTDVIYFMRDYQGKLKDAILIPTIVGSYLIPKNKLKSLIAVKVLSGDIKPEATPGMIKKLTDNSELIEKQFGKEIIEHEQLLRKSKDDLSYFLNERARLREASTTGSLRLVKDTVVRKSRKEAYNSVVYMEWEYTPTSVVLTDV